jgi:hypothetical protein
MRLFCVSLLLSTLNINYSIRRNGEHFICSCINTVYSNINSSFVPTWAAFVLQLIRAIRLSRISPYSKLYKNKDKPQDNPKKLHGESLHKGLHYNSSDKKLEGRMPPWWCILVDLGSQQGKDTDLTDWPRHNIQVQYISHWQFPTEVSKMLIFELAVTEPRSWVHFNELIFHRTFKWYIKF